MKPFQLFGSLALVVMLSACHPMMWMQSPDVHNVYFGFDSASISEEGAKTVMRVASKTNKATRYMIHLAGSADKQGDMTYNEMLAKKRAMAVKDALVKQGVNKDHIMIKDSYMMDKNVANWKKRVVKIKLRSVK